MATYKIPCMLARGNNDSFSFGQVLDICINVLCWFHVPPLSDKHASLKVGKLQRVQILLDTCLA